MQLLSVGFILYSASTLAYLALTAYAFSSWRKKYSGRALGLTALLSFSWSLSITAQFIYDWPSFETRITLEVLRNGAWFFFLLRTLGVTKESLMGRSEKHARYLSLCAALITLAPLLLLSASRLTIYDLSGHIEIGSNLLVFFVVSTIFGLVLVEQVLRNTRSDKQWNIKFLGLGVGALFAFDFCLYSDALLFNRINVTLWDTRGALNLLAVPLIIVSSQRSRAQALKFNLSREFMFHSTSLLGTGIYLLIMSVAGYYIRIFGGTWGGVFQIIFFLIALLLLLLIVFSGKIRANFRVYLSRNFFSYKYDYRDEWIRITQILSQAGEDPLTHRVITSLATIVQSPGGQLWLESEAGNFVLTDRTALALPSITLEPSNSPLCKFLRNSEWIIDIEELQRDPDLYNHLELPDWLRQLSAAWLIVPLMLHQSLSGFVVIKKPPTTHTLNWEDHDLIKIAGRQAASYIAQEQAMLALSQAREFQAFNQMSAFVVHDIKTLIAQLSLLVNNAEKHKSNPAFIDDMIKTTDHSVKKMTHLLEQFKSGNSSEPNQKINLKDLLISIIQSKANQSPLPTLSIAANCDDIQVDVNREQLHSVLGHIIQNAQEASTDADKVEIKIHHDEQWAHINITDTGSGMSEQFIKDKLFQPFQSTKGVTGMGIGVYQCQQYIQRLGGGIKVKSELGKGSEFDIFIPMIQ